MKTRVIVAGGGASGLAAGIWAAREGAAVTILERNDRPGRKLSATGNGRCNFSNLKIDEDSFRGTDPDFAAPALKDFGPEDAAVFFRDMGLLWVRNGSYLYPRNMQAASVAAMLADEFAGCGGKLKTNERIRRIEPGEKGFTVSTDTWHYEADAVILALGSSASAIAGSGTDGYELAESLGHHIVTPLPALTALKCAGFRFGGWAGVRTQGAVTLLVDGRKVKRAVGELQLTGYGISGIPVFDVSRYAVRALWEKKNVQVSLDFLPELDCDAAAELFALVRERYPNRSLKSLLAGWFPDKLAEVLASREDPVKSVKDFRLHVTDSLSSEHAQACSGGVDTSEIDPASMQSRLVKGLFFCGELVDIDGNCGGYNLQWAWSSGRCAGRNAAYISRHGREQM